MVWFRALYLYDEQAEVQIHVQGILNTACQPSDAV